MKLLALETAAEACSAALYLEGELTSRFQVKPRGHSELILTMMDELLAEAGLHPNQLDALAFGRGPGSFTGVRIATGVVQGVAFAAELPVVPVSTLAALAQRAFRECGERRLLPAFDARMGELYWGAYRVDDAGIAQLQGQELVAQADQVSLPNGEGWYGIGGGWQAYGEQLRPRLGAQLKASDGELLCRAEEVSLLGVDGFARGEAVAAEAALPVYLRDQVAKKPRS